MDTITTHEAKTHLSRYLAAVEAGEEFIIARGSKPVAKLVPYVATRPDRPKVGEMIDKPFHIPDSAFAPMTEKDMEEEWGW